MFLAASEAVVIFYTMHSLYGSAISPREDQDQSLFPLGDMTFTVCITLIATKLQALEQRNRTAMAAVGWVLSVGGWWLWNLILAKIYRNQTSPEYFVKGNLYEGFGRSLLWWLTLIVSVVACLGLEVVVRAAKCAVWPTDTEVFQTLEGDASATARFEEASRPWLWRGWDKEGKKGEAPFDVQEGKRDGEAREIWKSRGDGAVQTEEQRVMVDGGPGRDTVEIQDLLALRFGRVRRETLDPTR